MTKPETLFAPQNSKCEFGYENCFAGNEAVSQNDAVFAQYLRGFSLTNVVNLSRVMPAGGYHEPKLA